MPERHYKWIGKWTYQSITNSKIIIEDEIIWTVHSDNHFEGYGELKKRMKDDKEENILNKYPNNPRYRIKGVHSPFCLAFYFYGMENEQNLAGVAFLQMTPVPEKLNGEWIQLNKTGRIIKGEVTLTLAERTGKDKTIILIHGIRTDVHWAKIVKRVIENECNANVEIPKYGYFDVFNFILPVLTRNIPLRKITNSIHSIKGKYPDLPIYIVAHSFGSYLIANFLEENDQISVDGLILCGSIVDENFNWKLLEHRVKHILNNYSYNDLWPILAKNITWGYGYSGSFGFIDSYVENQFFNMQHSGYFNDAFIKKYWVPFFNEGKIIDSEIEIKKPSIWQLGLRFLPIKWILIILLPLIILILIL